MTPILISAIVILVSLILGAIGVGIYIAVFRNRPENRGKEPDTSVIVLIMTSAFLLGLLVVSGYFLFTGKECPECEWGAKDVQELSEAQATFDKLERRANRVPRDLSYTAKCDADPSGRACGIRARNV